MKTDKSINSILKNDRLPDFLYNNYFTNLLITFWDYYYLKYMFLTPLIRVIFLDI